MSTKIIMADDGLSANVVGAWAEEKHQRVASYVGVTSAVRRKYTGPTNAGAAYLEPYCAYGRANVRGTNNFIDGSSVRAWRESLAKKSAFTQFCIGDIENAAVETCSLRLKNISCQPLSFVGPANETVPRMISGLNPHGLHFAFLDPYNLASLPFTIIENLAKVKRMDMLIHVSSQDLQRNFEQYLGKDNSVLDGFAPGWRQSVDQQAAMSTQRSQVFNHWRNLISAAGKNAAHGIEHVTASKNQTLYWLVLVSSSSTAHELWEKIRNVGGQQSFF